MQATEAEAVVLHAISTATASLDLADQQLGLLPPALTSAIKVARAGEAVDLIPALEFAKLLPLLEGRSRGLTPVDVEQIVSTVRTLDILVDELPVTGEVGGSPLSLLGDAAAILSLGGDEARAVRVEGMIDQLAEASADGDIDKAERILKRARGALHASSYVRQQKTLIRTCRRFCDRLTNLYLSNNALSELPEELSYLTRLQVLDISDNSVQHLPKWLEGMRELRTLVADANRIVRIEADLSHLSALTTLSLGDNEIRSVPPGVVDLPRLTELNVRGNKLADLPEQFGQAGSLQTVDISDNAITVLPSSLGDLDSLQSLYANGNQVHSIELDLPKQLSVLALSRNALESVPPALSLLEHLEVLDLSENRLATLPIELASLPEGIELHVDGNPLSRTLLAAERQGTEALRSYLSSLAEPTDPCREAKLVLIGEGNVGKSSLVASLADEPFVVGRETTHGIELQAVDLVDDVTGSTVRLNAWDFGGQEIYRVTHQFYLSHDAVFLVVWRPREGFEQSGVEYWINRVRRLVGDRGRIILVSTHADEGRANHINVEELQYEFYPLIVGHVEVDNSSGYGVETLKKVVASAALGLEHIDDPIAASWIAVRRELLSRDGPFVALRSYDEICHGRGVARRSGRAWLELMHSLGYLIYFGSDYGLRDVIVTDPELLAKAVSYVLEDKMVIESGGIISHEYLVDLWSENLAGFGSDYGLYPYLLRLMERHDICFRLPDIESTLVAPVVTHRRPLDLPWEHGDQVAVDESELRAVFVFGSEPSGLIPWLTVRTVRWSVDRHWRAGFFVQRDDDHSSAVVETDGTELAVTVRGPYPVDLFSVLLSEVRWLLDERWPYLQYELYIPCDQCGEARPHYDPGRFSVAALQRAATQGLPELQCNECFRAADIGSLLTGIPSNAGDGVGDLFLRLSEQLAETEVRLAREMSRSAGVAGEVIAHVRELRKTIALVASECPRLFSLAPTDGARVDPRRIWRSSYSLQLWCEFSDGPHPHGDPYEFTRPKEWFVRAAPLIRAMHRALRFVPVLGRVQGLGEVEVEGIRVQMEGMAALSEALWDVTDGLVGGLEAAAMTAKGVELRAVKELLLEVDPPPQGFRGLAPATAEGAEVLWVCPTHYGMFDPGLPSLPSPTSDVA